MLANAQFGGLADEAGTGHLWYGNSHENRITPWQNDPLADQGAERLLLVRKQEENSLFAARDGLETNITYGGCLLYTSGRRGCSRSCPLPGNSLVSSYFTPASIIICFPSNRKNCRTRIRRTRSYRIFLIRQCSQSRISTERCV